VLDLDVDPMGSLDSLRSEASSSAAFMDSDAANSCNDVSSSDRSSRRLSGDETPQMAVNGSDPTGTTSMEGGDERLRDSETNRECEDERTETHMEKMGDEEKEEVQEAEVGKELEDDLARQSNGEIDSQATETDSRVEEKVRQKANDEALKLQDEQAVRQEEPETKQDEKEIERLKENWVDKQESQSENIESEREEQIEECGQTESTVT
jgi:hypothetical protein